jgi:hypothetical protein
VDGWVAHQSTCLTGSRCNWLARSAGQRTQYSVFSWTQRERDGEEGTEADTHTNERERERERERWRDLGGSVCLSPVPLLLLCLCHNFSETHLVLLVGFCCCFLVGFFLFRFGICLLSQEVICLSISLSKSAQLGGCSYCPM